MKYPLFCLPPYYLYKRATTKLSSHKDIKHHERLHQISSDSNVSKSVSRISVLSPIGGGRRRVGNASLILFLLGLKSNRLFFSCNLQQKASICALCKTFLKKINFFVAVSEQKASSFSHFRFPNSFSFSFLRND